MSDQPRCGTPNHVSEQALTNLDGFRPRPEVRDPESHGMTLDPMSTCPQS